MPSFDTPATVFQSSYTLLIPCTPSFIPFGALILPFNTHLSASVLPTGIGNATTELAVPMAGILDEDTRYDPRSQAHDPTELSSSCHRQDATMSSDLNRNANCIPKHRQLIENAPYRSMHHPFVLEPMAASPSHGCPSYQASSTSDSASTMNASYHSGQEPLESEGSQPSLSSNEQCHHIPQSTRGMSEHGAFKSASLQQIPRTFSAPAYPREQLWGQGFNRDE
jgi:hypothetical protein